MKIIIEFKIVCTDCGTDTGVWKCKSSPIGAPIYLCVSCVSKREDRRIEDEKNK